MANLLDVPVLMPDLTGLSRMMETVTESQRQINQFIDNLAFPIVQMQKTMVSMMDPVLQMQRMLGESPFIKMAEEIHEANKRMAELMTFNPIFPYLRQVDDVVEGEVLADKNVAALANNTTLVPRQSIKLSLPAVTQAKVNYCDTFENFHMAATIEGRFYYEDRLLEHISSNSKHGQFLLLLLEADNNYITDEFSLSKLNPSDLEKGLGYIRDDLAKCLAKDGLSVKLYRNRKKGYKLLKIAPPSN